MTDYLIKGLHLVNLFLCVTYIECTLKRLESHKGSYKPFVGLLKMLVLIIALFLFEEISKKNKLLHYSNITLIVILSFVVAFTLVKKKEHVAMASKQLTGNIITLIVALSLVTASLIGVFLSYYSVLIWLLSFVVLSSLLLKETLIANKDSAK